MNGGPNQQERPDKVVIHLTGRIMTGRNKNPPCDLLRFTVESVTDDTAAVLRMIREEAAKLYKATVPKLQLAVYCTKGCQEELNEERLVEQ